MVKKREERDLHSTEEWVKILKKQAEDTKKYRHALYETVNLNKKELILDVGCGTGVITGEIASLATGQVVGIDLNEGRLREAHRLTSSEPRISLARTDLLEMPFRENTFDLVTFSVVLTHVQKQQEAICEMVRVVKKGGIILAAMEPDYEGMLHYPEDEAHQPFMDYLKDMGVELQTGRKLKYFFEKAGLITTMGMFSDYFEKINEDPQTHIEEFLEHFPKTEKILLQYGWDTTRIEDYKKRTVEYMKKNLLFSFCPCFNAIGIKQ
ncbi:MAG: methyltransferase domain-containing protein [Theionarchaea archaeon]|nr:methyltransferase domain-containing protein [Theionarchaea archaeon]